MNVFVIYDHFITRFHCNSSFIDNTFIRIWSNDIAWFHSMKFKDPSRSKTWNRQIIYLRTAVFSLNITIQAWSAFIACEMNKSIPTLTVEGLENGQTERRNTALRGVKIYDIMSCRIPACMIQVCIRKVLSVFFSSWLWSHDSCFLNTLQLNIRCLNVLYCILRGRYFLFIEVVTTTLTEQKNSLFFIIVD